ncbi:nuclear transport factor 2 family protein [Nesterenkonia sp.]|uniref:nuclear transport factor 2 family protein n=1 Tax=Nesterenkonia sp. TaxID=704201 RepID=UPI00261E49C7|nr:nuclear transport factor 2 family protein [Nesterenkonia sp.]
MAIVSDFAAQWAAGDAGALAAWLAEDAVWTLVGDQTHHGSDAAERARAPLAPQRLEIRSVITHGRFASCDGRLTDGARSIEFSHVMRFTGAGKTAKIAEIRSYCIESAEHTA